MRRWVAIAITLAPVLARGDDVKRCVDARFTPTDNLQIVAWIETPTGQYVDTAFVTQQTGTYGLGNRPGRFDLNSGPRWPYGRRLTTFPVWSHAHGTLFPYVIFQENLHDDPDYCFTAPDLGNGDDFLHCPENNVSRLFSVSSTEHHYCRPISMGESLWDAGTCATTVFTDKGRFSTSPKQTGYPPRADLVRSASDSASVDMFRIMNPFDAVSQATPAAGQATDVAWPVPQDLALGDYVLVIETSKEADFNSTYNSTSLPSPVNIPWGEYGTPYRGQPSVVYRVPFTIATTGTTVATAQDYAGYGDPTGADGAMRAPDATITIDTPGSGGARLELLPDPDHAGAMYRVRVAAAPIDITEIPGIPDRVTIDAVSASGSTVSFVAPGIGASNAEVTGYEIRFSATEMTVDNFSSALQIAARVTPEAAGTVQTFELANLLPETDYWVGIRAYDKCRTGGDIAIVKLTTLERQNGSVDACFVATAAYGSVMANDVELLRHFRDTMLASNVVGELGVEAYYTFGPLLAAPVGESDLLRTTARDALAPIIRSVRTLAY